MHKPIRFPQGDVGIAPYIFEKSPTCPQHLQSLKSEETATFFQKASFSQLQWDSAQWRFCTRLFCGFQ